MQDQMALAVFNEKQYDGLDSLTDLLGDDYQLIDFPIGQIIFSNKTVETLVMELCETVFTWYMKFKNGTQPTFAQLKDKDTLNDVWHQNTLVRIQNGTGSEGIQSMKKILQEAANCKDVQSLLMTITNHVKIIEADKHPQDSNSRRRKLLVNFVIDNVYYLRNENGNFTIMPVKNSISPTKHLLFSESVSIPKDFYFKVPDENVIKEGLQPIYLHANLEMLKEQVLQEVNQNYIEVLYQPQSSMSSGFFKMLIEGPQRNFSTDDKNKEVTLDHLQNGKFRFGDKAEKNPYAPGSSGRAAMAEFLKNMSNAETLQEFCQACQELLKGLTVRSRKTVIENVFSKYLSLSPQANNNYNSADIKPFIPLIIDRIAGKYQSPEQVLTSNYSTFIEEKDVPLPYVYISPSQKAFTDNGQSQAAVQYQPRS